LWAGLSAPFASTETIGLPIRCFQCSTDIINIAAVNIRDLDLNLLVVFDAVMEARSMTLAGERLGQAQPTVSHALNRLRRIVGDPLFVRARHGIEPTPYAQQLAGSVSLALDHIRSGLARTVRFDPATARVNFTLLMSDIGQTSLLPALVRRIDRVAPGVTLIAAQLPRSEYADALQSGHADLAIGALRELKAGFYQQKLFTDEYVGVVSRDHPKIGDTLTLEEYLAARHVGIISPGLSDTEVDRLLLPPGRSRRIAVRVPHFLAAPALIPGTSLVVTVPSRVLMGLANRTQVKMASLGFAAPAITVHQYWHERSHHDETSRWLRALVAELFAEAQQAP
jgi:DNA-binding transcriptional LysR family regulator